MWTHRIMLEASLYSANAFLTLTYDDQNLKTSSGASVPVGGQTDLLPSLQPVELRNWLKRFRREIAPLLIRFYAVGEYGDETGRPHYHVALFNAGPCARGRTLRRPGSGRPLWHECCVFCRTVGATWGHGDVDVGVLETSSAQYICGYVTKKMTAKDDSRLSGRYPEFSRMSRMPGIGVGAMHEVASQFMKFNLEEREADVPSALRHGNRLMPLGRHLRRKLRAMVGKDEKAPQATLDKMAEEMRPLLEATKVDTALIKSGEVKAVILRNRLIDAGLQKRRNQAARSAIFNKGKAL